MPERRLIDGVKLHVDFPQEEDFGLGNEVFFSFYYWFYFPGDSVKVAKEFLDLSNKDEAQISKFKKDYLKFEKRCLLNVGGEKYIAKNSCFVGLIFPEPGLFILKETLMKY